MPGHNVIAVTPTNSLSCPHCGLYLGDAVQTEYGDLLCKTCYQEIAAMESQKCPCCRVDASVDFHIDRYVRREVEKLRVKCPKASTGCEWQGKLALLKEHRKECRGLQEPCSNRGCGLFVTVDKWEQHAECCPYREATCQYCGRKLQLNELGPHYDECERFLVSCPRCEARVAREELTDHMTTKCSGSKPPSPEPPERATFCTYPRQESQENQKVNYVTGLLYCKELGTVPAMAVKHFLSELAKVKAQYLELKTQNYEIGQLLLRSTMGSDGTLVWKITEISSRRKALLEKKVQYIESPPFSTKKYGYKLCLRIYLIGDDRHDGYMSVSIIMLEGEYDAILKWPFKASISLQLPSLSSSTYPDLEDSCSVLFQRPPMYHSFPQFAKLSDESAHYVKDNAMFLKCTVSVDAS